MRYRLRVDVWIEPEPRAAADGRLRVSEELTVAAGSFLEVAKILGQFHDVAERVGAPGDGTIPPPRSASA